MRYWQTVSAGRLRRHGALTGALVLVLCLLMLSGAAARAQAEYPVGDFVPGQIVVELRSTGGHQTAQSSNAKLRGLNADYGTSTLKPLPTDSAVYLL